MRQKLQLLLPPASILTLIWVIRSIYISEDHIRRFPRPALFHLNNGQDNITHGEPAIDKALSPSSSAWNNDGKILPAEKIKVYLDGILGRGQTDLPTIECPAFNKTRYEPLIADRVVGPEIRWFFALNLRECIGLLPRLLGSIVEVMRFLGPQNCALSIVEGQSPDGTGDVLVALEAELKALGVKYYFRSSTIDTKEGDRIGKLAELRNMALEPLYFNPDRAGNNTTVVFLNDVAACADDILELAFQRQNLGADMTCGMDWNYPDPGPPRFYDVWISRDINGESFFRITDEGGWERGHDLFWDSPVSKARFEQRRPFQVFACWNGGAVFRALPLIKDHIRFRSSYGALGECFQGEPQLFCKDLWFHGYRKIAIVPSVNLEYTVDNGKRIKQEKGFVTHLVADQDPAADSIVEWLGPPDNVRCMPGFDRQSMPPWNESLVHGR